MVARAAKTWGCRPSDLLGIREPRQALDLDLALAQRLRMQNAREFRELNEDGGFLTPILVALLQLQ